MDKEKTIKYFKEKIDWLVTHNKNYTKEQYYTLLDLQEKIEFLENEIKGGN